MPKSKALEYAKEITVAAANRGNLVNLQDTVDSLNAVFKAITVMVLA
jgi:hypothetical protein